MPKKKQQSYLEKLTEECNEKYKGVPKHQLRFVPLISEFNLDYLVFKNKNDKIQFIEIDGNNYGIPYYIENYAYENQGHIPDLWELNKEHREYMLKNMFSEDGYSLETFDWNSLNPNSGYYLCYYRKIGKNKWVYNFNIFEYDNDYGYWTNFEDNQSYKRENIMSFLFLESL